MSGALFLRYKQGVFGLGLKNTRKGDAICVVLGAPVLFILSRDRHYLLNNKWKLVSSFETSKLNKLRPLRSFPTGDRFYPVWEFVGDAYVQTIMNYYGDIKNDTTNGRLVLEDFYLH
jgi:hypothetical protein